MICHRAKTECGLPGSFSAGFMTGIAGMPGVSGSRPADAPANYLRPQPVAATIRALSKRLSCTSHDGRARSEGNRRRCIFHERMISRTLCDSPAQT